MPYAEHAAAPKLRTLIACYWRIDEPSAGHRVLPDGCIDILVAGDAEGARVVGCMRTALLTPPSRRGAIGIRFRPGEAWRLLPDAPRELSDRSASLDVVWGGAAHELDTLLNEARDAGPALGLATIAARLDAALSRRLTASAGPVDLAVRAAAAKLDEGQGVALTAAQVGLSPRQLARRFETRVGLSPKSFAQVMRLQRATAALASGASAGDAAQLAGYADQAHFTRESKVLAGATPRVLAQELGRHTAESSDSFKTVGCSRT